ncbi:OmpW family outer membrane protein [Acinetobacter schindleri]|jgi:outer membrane protein|uniref:OmpW/AlkL family protein n=2 Tax=Acinetobacter TaxID=469 RepID=UPI0032B58C4E
MLKQVALIALMGLSVSAMAGQWQVKVGASVLAPTQETDLIPGTVNDAKASSELNFTPSVEYFFNDNVSAELLLATPFNHDVDMAGGVKIASLKHLPPTLTAKYNFKNSSRFTPYVGVGATVFIPWDEEFSQAAKNVLQVAKLDADVSYGVAGQIGFNFQPADAKNWGVFVDARYADLNTDLEAKTANGTKIDLGEFGIDPWVYTIGYSYKF